MTKTIHLLLSHYSSTKWRKGRGAYSKLIRRFTVGQIKKLKNDLKFKTISEKNTLNSIRFLFYASGDKMGLTAPTSVSRAPQDTSF